MDKAEQEDQIESTKPLFPLLLLLMTSFTPRFRNLALNLQIRKLSRLDGKKSSWSCLPPGGPTAAQLSSYLAGLLACVAVLGAAGRWGAAALVLGRSALAAPGCPGWRLPPTPQYYLPCGLRPC